MKNKIKQKFKSVNLNFHLWWILFFKTLKKCLKKTKSEINFLLTFFQKKKEKSRLFTFRRVSFVVFLIYIFCVEKIMYLIVVKNKK